jgi:uncharacterized SAM-binding protein YcdF (DUF218 family)
MSDKILASFAYPLGFVLAALLIAGVAIACGARRSGALSLFVLALLLWAASTPLVAQWAIRTLETEYPARSVESHKPADVIILLGGVLSPPGPGDPYPDLGDAADRAVHALRLYQAGLAPKLLISGGNIYSDGRMPEAQALAELLESLGVPQNAILVEGASTNTFENARESALIWQGEGFRSGLLVTSAMHMPRALATFRKAGLAIAPAPTDRRGEHVLPPFPLCPRPEASIKPLRHSKSGSGFLSIAGGGGPRSAPLCTDQILICC